MTEMDNLQEADGVTSQTNSASIETNDAIVKDALAEIENVNAEDAEDHDNAKRHEIPTKDYHSMDMDALVEEFLSLLKNHPIQAINSHVNQIKDEFNAKFSEFIETKKEEFVANGGSSIDFRYSSNTKNNFNKVYSDYKTKRNAYYKDLEQNLNRETKIWSNKNQI